MSMKGMKIMKKILILILTLLVPFLLFFEVWGVFTNQQIQKEIDRLEVEQGEWLEKNKKLIAAIAVYSSPERVEMLVEKELDLKKPEPEDFLAILSSHDKAPYSPCRHPTGEVGGATLGTAFYDLRKGLFRLYRGNPCEAVKENRYTDYEF